MGDHTFKLLSLYICFYLLDLRLHFQLFFCFFFLFVFLLGVFCLVIFSFDKITFLSSVLLLF